jgi:hypothetical protein
LESLEPNTRANITWPLHGFLVHPISSFPIPQLIPFNTLQLIPDTVTWILIPASSVDTRLEEFKFQLLR